MHILVTGGAGYIGSHTCKMLHQKGFVPITYDNLSTGHKYLVQWGPLVEGDLRDQAKLSKTFAAYPIKAVIHFAAKALVGESMKNPLDYYSNNVLGTISLLEAMKRHEVPYIIFSSSCATYGHPMEVPITEDHPQKPISPYGMSKWMIEKVLLDMALKQQIYPGILRYFNAAGADSDLMTGEDHTPESHLIPNILLSILHKRPFYLFGRDFSTKDGTAVRDYIHVTDLAAAHILALQWILEKHTPLCVNLGTGEGFSVQQMIDLCRKITHKELEIIDSPRREGDPAILVASNQKALDCLKWTPQYSQLDNIVTSAWEWHKKKP
ncbi:MAG: UDP-glucose 4-epimerase GalE [Parachlamydiales bacterium]|nr:UDP-glucose 4-epimerase GalE [Parachlamydiales bacterium]